MGADLAEEEQFGPYLVYERLGVGGMATVHRAIERGAEDFERVVALKRLLPHLAEDASFIKSFVREAKLASMLNHVNIVQIYELGRVGAEYFISMEYIDGRDVRRVLRHARKVTGPPPIHVTVGLVAQLCEALDYAHQQTDEHGHPLGLVHRDVSPSNVLVTLEGHVKVIDFGIAKAQSSQLRTQTGRVKGKLAYMAPEAIAGKDLDARSDLWAVGVILHELLTARPLFASKNEYQTLLKVQRGDIMPPSTFNQGCPPELDAIVFKALARDPDDRFSTAGELRDELMALRRQYQLASGYRDVAAWLDWAFSLEVPNAGFAGNTGDNTGSSAFQDSLVRHGTGKTPKPSRNRDEDEAVEMVWGTSEGEQHSGPVLLDDIPDVSDKHRAVQPAADDIDDDLPTPAPSHGSPSRELPIVRGTDSDVDATVARGSDRMAAQRAGTQPRPQPRTRTSSEQSALLPRPKKPTVPMPAGSTIPRRRAETNAQTDPEGRRLEGTTDPTAQPLGARALAHLDAEGTFNRDDPADTLVGMQSAPLAPAPARRPSSPPPPPRPSTPPPPPRKSERIGSMGDEITRPEAVPIDAPAAPIVRFSKSPSSPPANKSLADLVLEPPPPVIPTTMPGVGVDAESSLATTKPRIRRSSDIVIGAAVVERNKPAPRRAWVLLLLLLLAGGAATGITLMLTRGKDKVTLRPEPPPALPAPVVLTIKFITEPADAEIRIEGHEPHVGSPWSIELAPGAYQVEVRRDGYNSWLTKLELSASDGITQAVRTALVPRGNGAVSTDATLAVTTTPEGLDVYLDGELQAQKTPFKATVRLGSHVVTLQQNGVEVWKQSFTAEASANYEYNPVVTAERQKERSERSHSPSRNQAQAITPTPVVPAQLPEPMPIIPVAPVVPPDAAVEAPPPVIPPPVPHVEPPKPPVPAVVPVVPPHPTAPVIIAPSAVTKLSGDVPKLSTSTAGLGGAHRDALPAFISAKVCIDPAGSVTSVDPLGKLDRDVRQDLINGLRSWRYAPYKKAGAALAACFVVSLRTK
jgi:serine/threonine protein kinase